MVLQGSNAAVFERVNSAGALARLRNFPANEAGEQPLRELAQWLDAARRADSFERLMLVAPEDDAWQLVSGLSRPTRALLAAMEPEVLQNLPAEIQADEPGPPAPPRLRR